MARGKGDKGKGLAVRGGSSGSALPVGRPIRPDDIQAKLDEIDAELNATVDSAKTTGATIAAAAGVVLLVVVFVLGKRRGRKTSTVVTVRRI